MKAVGHMKTRGSYEKYNPATGQSDWSNTLSYAIIRGIVGKFEIIVAAKENTVSS